MTATVRLAHKESPLMRLLRTLLLLAALPAAALAADAPPTYRVELVLFEHTDPNAFHSERWPQDAGLPDMTAALDVFAGGREAKGFKALPEASGELGAVAELLDKSERYQVILRRVWQQPGLDADNAVPVAIHGGTDYAPTYPQLMASRWEYDAQGVLVEIPGPTRLQQVDGWVKIVLGRYLHVSTDLAFRKPVMLEHTDPATQEVTRTPGLYTIRVEEKRRMRSRELHYIDHPLLGILVKITPVTGG